MAISLKLLLYKSKTYSDGTHPIILQYIIDRKTKRKVITRCKPEDWDEKSKRVKGKVRNSAIINHYISEELMKAEKVLYDVLSGVKVKHAIFEPEAPLTFDQAIALELDRLKLDMKAAAFGKLIIYSSQVNDFSKASLQLKEMDLAWFKSFANYLNGIGNVGTTAHKKIKTIRALVCKYLDDDKLKNELKSFRVPMTKNIKRKLTRDELKSIENLMLPEVDLICASRDLFLLQIYLRGIRVGDLLQAYSHQFTDGAFDYIDDKTGKSFSMKIISKAQAIIDKYKEKHERLFPFFTWEEKTKLSVFENKRKRLKEKEACTALINKNLKIIAVMAGIDKVLSTHIARHTYARMAIDKIKNPMITMELLGHSSLAVHQIYLKDITNQEEMDKANDEVFSED